METGQDIRIGTPAFSAEDILSAANLSRVIHRIGHEIGNPLTSIISLSSIIERGIGESGAAQLPIERVVSYAGSIGSEAWRISSINEKLVMLLSSRQGNPEPSEPESIIRRALHKLQRRAEHKRFDVEFRRASPQCQALVDPEQAAWVFLNKYFFLFFQRRPYLRGESLW